MAPKTVPQRESVCMAEITIRKSLEFDDEISQKICVDIIDALSYFGNERLVIDQIDLWPRIVGDECVLSVTITHRASGRVEQSTFELNNNWSPHSIALAIKTHTGIPLMSEVPVTERLVSTLGSIPITPIG